MNACGQRCSMWLALLLLHSAGVGCAWVTYSEPDSLPGFSEPLLTDAKRKPIRLHLSASSPYSTSPDFSDGFKKGASALAPYYWEQPFHRTIVSTGNEKVIMCQLDVSTDSSVGRGLRNFLYGLTFFLVPYEEEREFTLALKLLVGDSEIKTASYVVKERYYKWLFAVQAPSSLSGEWMSADNRDPNRSLVVQRFGAILGKTAAAFCRDR
jgi:hypothetical protein